MHQSARNFLKLPARSHVQPLLRISAFPLLEDPEGSPAKCPKAGVPFDVSSRCLQEQELLGLDMGTRRAEAPCRGSRWRLLRPSVDYYAAVNRKPLTHAATWVNLKGLMLSIRSQTPKGLQVARTWDCGKGSPARGHEGVFWGGRNKCSVSWLW